MLVMLSIRVRVVWAQTAVLQWWLLSNALATPVGTLSNPQPPQPENPVLLMIVATITRVC